MALLALAAPSVASGADADEFGVKAFTTSVVDAGGVDLAQAGAHPFSATASFAFNTTPEPEDATDAPIEPVRTIVTDLPAGFVGNPRITSKRCTTDQLNRGACPIESQVGVAEVRYFGGSAGVGILNGVYNMVPSPGYPAEFGLKPAQMGIVKMLPEVRSDSDFGLRITVPYVVETAVIGATLTFWGTPADPAHDAQRFVCFPGGAFCLGGHPSPDPPRPFLTNPATECTDKQPVTKLSVDSWNHPGVFKDYFAASPLITGCERLTFDPAAQIAPSTTAPDAPSGLDVDLTFPQEDNAEGLAPPALKRAVVTLPEGMTINPSGAGGLAACADGELLLKSKDPSTCPDASKVGEVTATSPLLEETLSGGVYIRSQNSRDPESGEMFRIALVLENAERGLSIRLPGQIKVNRRTGRIETIFDNNPELPVDHIKLTFKQGSRAPLATPPTCGPKTIDTVLTSWGGQTKALQSTFDVDCVPGLGGFSPGFQAGTQSPVAGASSPFNLLLSRADGQDVVNGLRLAMPEGLLANLKGNVGTQVGTVAADAGPGSQPYRFPGRVFLEGPYDDAPFSLRVVIPAKAGPFDLGEVVVRQKIYIDPITAQVTVVSDPIPTIVEGVPVRLRSLRVDVDKPGFMINPTSCAETRIGAIATSLGGQSAGLANRFQVGGCENLPVKPKLQIDVVGKKQLSYHQHPGISATVTQRRGEAGLKKVAVTMPLSLALDTKNAKALCKPAQAQAKACPAGSIVGNATAISPVLNRPLKGNVYFVEGTRVTSTGRVTATLPKLWVALRGEVALDVWADSDVKAKKLVTTFARVPDAPISSFELNIDGGENGILQVTGKPGAHICNQSSVANATFDGQNGKQLVTATHMRVPCPFREVSSTLEAREVRVRMTGLGAGRLTVSGPGVRTTRRTLKAAPLATIRARLTASGQRARRAGRGVRVKVAFAPKGGKVKSIAVAVNPVKKTSARRSATK